jgi:hypothetical protein
MIAFAWGFLRAARSTILVSIPRRINSVAIIRPVGPAPTTSASLSTVMRHTSCVQGNGCTGVGMWEKKAPRRPAGRFAPDDHRA